MPLDGSPAAFTFERVERRFGEKQVLRGLDLSLEDGRFLAIIGRSGCGKSTLLRLLAGLDAPDGGRITRSAAATGPAGTRIMFQEPRLLPWASIAGNVEVGLTGLADRAEARRRAHDILAGVGLEGRGAEWPAVLSGGQRQRVALARALIGAPRILALDEPLGALDALTRIGMQRLLERVWAEKGFTAVLVTHDVAEAVILADRVILLDEGRIARDIAVDLPRPRHHGSPEVAALEQQILQDLLHGDA
ncbi:ATP-binding cassette domain-containing protein [Oceanicella sp. SM1341]|uniref:ATP-binding cassette domain-containing protein n=1 Tax=Oceanicella sp. SM1341 TaxID=1548889 RepID=UPI000E4CEA09|nr:ATP-binding cassette domain-containing protein [Oceanicella sp. SM1341]